jgi:hypothetical protein
MSIAGAQFPLSCVVQPAFLLAYLSTYSIPDAFNLLPELQAGTIVGMTMVITALVRFRIASTQNEPSSTLSQVLLPNVHEHFVYKISPIEIGLMELTLAFVFLMSIRDRDSLRSLVLAVPLLITLSTKGGKYYVLVGLFAACVICITTQTAAFDGIFAAVASGVIFQSVSSQCFPLWDYAHQTRLGFKISSVALLSMYIAISTLKLVA